MTGFSLRPVTTLCLALIALGCAADVATKPMANREQATDGRKVAKTAWLSVEVAEPEKASTEFEKLVRGAGGYIERSTAAKDSNVSLDCRVPSAELDLT